MSYYTDFELSIFENEQDVDLVDVKRRLDQIMGDNGFPAFEVRNGLLRSVDELTWYSHDEDCALLSKDFPGVVFKLHGKGSGVQDDLWNAYYRDGLCQICRAQYPPYDPAKLMPVESVEETSLDGGMDDLSLVG